MERHHIQVGAQRLQLGLDEYRLWVVAFVMFSCLLAIQHFLPPNGTSRVTDWRSGGWLSSDDFSLAKFGFDGHREIYANRIKLGELLFSV